MKKWLLILLAVVVLGIIIAVLAPNPGQIQINNNEPAANGTSLREFQQLDDESAAAAIESELPALEETREEDIDQAVPPPELDSDLTVDF